MELRIVNHKTFKNNPFYIFIMSKYPHILALVLIIFISGCVEGSPRFSIFGLDIGPGEPTYTTSENLRIETEAIPSEIYEGKSTTIFFDIYNTGNSTLKDINLKMTDFGDFTASETSKHIPELKENKTETWSWKFQSTDLGILDERGQTLRYKLYYNSESSALYDIVVMSEDEYTRLERQGNLEEDIRLFYYKTKSPVEIDISISKDQPIFEGLEFYLYVKLKDGGLGTIQEIENLDIFYPDFVEFIESNDFTGGGGKLSLAKPLSFLNKETKKTTCKFKASGVNVRDIGQFKVQANYIYNYYKTINVKIKPK